MEIRKIILIIFINFLEFIFYLIIYQMDSEIHYPLLAISLESIPRIDICNQNVR